MKPIVYKLRWVLVLVAILGCVLIGRSYLYRQPAVWPMTEESRLVAEEFAKFIGKPYMELLDRFGEPRSFSMIDALPPEDCYGNKDKMNEWRERQLLLIYAYGNFFVDINYNKRVVRVHYGSPDGPIVAGKATGDK